MDLNRSITIRIPKTLYDQLAAHGKVSDVVRHALEQYVGQPSYDVGRELRRLNDLMEALSRNVLHPAEALAKQRKTSADNLPTHHYLGQLCDRGHEWQKTGQSRRYRSNQHCVECRTEDQRTRRKKKAPPNKQS